MNALAISEGTTLRDLRGFFMGSADAAPGSASAILGRVSAEAAGKWAASGSACSQVPACQRAR
jgi:hypothetical protein